MPHRLAHARLFDWHIRTRRRERLLPRLHSVYRDGHTDLRHKLPDRLLQGTRYLSLFICSFSAVSLQFSIVGLTPLFLGTDQCAPCTISSGCQAGFYADRCSGNTTTNAYCKRCAAPGPNRIFVPYSAQVSLQVILWSLGCSNACVLIYRCVAVSSHIGSRRETAQARARTTTTSTLQARSSARPACACAATRTPSTPRQASYTRTGARRLRFRGFLWRRPQQTFGPTWELDSRGRQQVSAGNAIPALTSRLAMRSCVPSLGATVGTHKW